MNLPLSPVHLRIVGIGRGYVGRLEERGVIPGSQEQSIQAEAEGSGVG